MHFEVIPLSFLYLSFVAQDFLKTPNGRRAHKISVDAQNVFRLYRLMILFPYSVIIKSFDDPFISSRIVFLITIHLTKKSVFGHLESDFFLWPLSGGFIAQTKKN